MRMKHQMVSTIFFAWYDYYSELKRNREISDRALRRMLNLKLHGLFRTWRHNAVENKHQRETCQRVLARVQRMTEARCINMWKELVLARQRVRERVVRATRKWINQNLTVGWRSWIRCIRS